MTRTDNSRSEEADWPSENESGKITPGPLARKEEYYTVVCSIFLTQVPEFIQLGM
jgi:hypothetical protein